MPLYGDYDHELKIGSTTQRFRLARRDDGSPLYTVEYITPHPPRDPLRFTMTDWSGGHGQHTFHVPNMYFEGQSIDTTQEGRVFLGPFITEVLESDDTALDSAPVKFFWFAAASKWLCATSGKIYIYGTKWTAAATTVAGVTDLIEYDDICYAACGASTLYYYSANGDTWTQTDLTDGYANYFTVSPNAAGTQEVLWKVKTPNEVSDTTNGRTVAASGVQWSTPAFIGDISNDITNIFTHADELLIGKTNGQFHYDSAGGVHPLRKDLEENISTDNFKYITYWQAGLYFSEINGMGEITGSDAYEPMGPLTKVGDGALGDIGKRGSIVGLAADKDWLYVAIDEGTNTHIYKGREVRKGGVLRWEWCPWIYLGVNLTATLATCQHSATDRRLWFGYGTSGTTTAYVILSDNPTDDSAAKFCASGWLRMSYDYGSEAEWDKLWQSAVLEVVGGASGETVQVKYRKDTDSSTGTSIIAAAATNGIFESNFSAEVSCERIQFELWLASDTSTATPEVSYFQAKGVEKPVEIRVHDATYLVDDDPSQSAKTLRDLLRTARTSTSLVRLADLRYNEYTGGTAVTNFVYVVMEAGYPKEVEVLHQDGRNPELGVNVRLREVSFS